MSTQPVVTRGLRRRYGRRVALDGVDLEVGSGRIVGLVGPNGSGKTTLLRMLSGFVRSDEGEARVFGLDPYAEQARVMERARFAFAPPALFESLTPAEHLERLTAIRPRHVAAPSAGEREASLRSVGLWERRHDRVRTFSFGMRQRLALAIAIVPLPELLILDEPTDGLDPLAVLELRQRLAELRSEHGIAILLASHLLVEIEELVDSMLVLDEGRPLFQGAPHELTRGARRLHIGTDEPVRALDTLRGAGLEGELIDGRSVELVAVNGVDPPGESAAGSSGSGTVADPELDLERTRALLRDAGLELRSFHVHRPTLEEALLERLRAARKKGERP